MPSAHLLYSAGSSRDLAVAIFIDRRPIATPFGPFNTTVQPETCSR